MAYSIIPLTSDPNQRFSITLSVNGGYLSLRFFVRWNETADYWLMDISNAKGEHLVTSLPLLVSEYPVANLLAAQSYLRIGSACLIPNGDQAGNQPTADNLGKEFVLVWSDNDVAA